MNGVSGWLPMRWPAGPLDIAQRSRVGPLAGDVVDTLRAWLDPSVLLEVLKGTPINCIVVSWASGLPEDEEQQTALASLIGTAQDANISVVGLLNDGAATPEKGVLAALAVGGKQSPATNLPIILWTKAERIRWNVTSDAVTITDGVWPGVQRQANSDTVTAGPTTLPWVYSNGALLTMINAKASGKPIWLAVDRPKDSADPSANDYVLSAVDAAVHGSRWVVSLDDRLRGGLASRDSHAVNVWEELTRTLEFLERTRGSVGYPAAGPLAVLSDFSVSERVLVQEVLNLLPRRRLPFRTMERSRALKESWRGLEAVFYADRQTPDPELQRKLLAFARSGGTVFTSSHWSVSNHVAVEAPSHLTFRLYRIGAGKLAIAKEEDPDPYEVACDLQAVMGRNRDALRLFNGTAVNAVYRASADSRKAAIHLVNYSRKKGMPFSLYLRDRFRLARLLTPETSGAAGLDFVPQIDGGVELPLPPIDVYGMVALEA